MNPLKILAYLFLTSIVFYSCTKEDDKKNDTSSTSPSDPRNVFVGNWVCQETIGSSITTFGVEIFTHSSISSRIVVSNFNNLGFQTSPCNMEISGNSITIFQQNLSGFDVVGSGTLINSSTINLTYQVDDGSGIVDNVSATLTKTN
jgi:hypothetical protein